MDKFIKFLLINFLLLISKINFKTGIPVLIYHRVLKSDEDKRVAYVSENVFRYQMSILKDLGFQTIDSETLTNFLSGKKAISKKSIVITFDDGFKDNLNAIRIAKEFGFNCIVFVATSFIGNSYKTIPYTGNISLKLQKEKAPNHDIKYLTEDELIEIKSIGTDIFPHTNHHVCLPKCDINEQITEIKSSLDQLEKILGPIYKSFSYPYGMYNEETIKILKNLGFQNSFEVSDGLNYYNEKNLFNVRRHNVGNSESRNYFKLILTDEYKYYRKIAYFFEKFKVKSFK